MLYYPSNIINTKKDNSSNCIEGITMSNVKIIAIVAVVAIVAIGAAAVFLNQDSGEDNEVKFLIQDDAGVYFWIEGSGDTVLDAFKDAAVDYGIPVEYSVYQGEENGIQKMFGLEMRQSGTDWFWWSQYGWDGSGWVSNTVSMNGLSPSDVHGYIAIVYGDGSNPALVEPEDCEVWDGDTDGTVFTIESSTGMWFKVNGTGATVYDAFTDAVGDYDIPFIPTTGMEGINSLFGLEMVNDPDNPSAWTYWVQKVMDAGEWVDAPKGMGELDSSDHPVFKIVYATFVF